MFRQSSSAVFLAFSLLASAFCVPMSELRIKRQSSSSTDSPNGMTRDSDDITITSNNVQLNNEQLNNEQLNNEQINNEVAADDAVDDEDDAFASYPDDNTSGGGGSNLFSLLGLVTSFLPGSSSSASIQKLLREIVKRNLPKVIIRRGGININEIDTNYIAGLNPPPLLRQENESNHNIETENNGSNESSDSVESLEDEESKNNSNQDLDTNEDSDYDEPPGGGDGEGGGLLGLLAGLSGDEDGQSDLGSLLATIGGIVANLSGDGIDLNSLIASGIGLFVGLLSEGEKNPGEIIASYLLTSLDTITGGGAKNNGAFFGKFLSKLVKGTSAALDPDADSEEAGNEMQSKDSAGFFVSFIMGLLGDMSKGSSGSHP